MDLEYKNYIERAENEIKLAEVILNISTNNDKKEEFNLLEIVLFIQQLYLILIIQFFIQQNLIFCLMELKLKLHKNIKKLMKNLKN